jgi:hypothetical protein
MMDGQKSIKLHILCSLRLVPKIVPFMRYCGKILSSGAGHRRQYNMAHAHCMLDKHTLTICNTYWFSTATMVARTPLNVPLYVHYLSCYNRDGVFTARYELNL